MVKFNLLAESSSGRKLRARVVRVKEKPHAACLFVANHPDTFSLPEWLINNSFIHPSHHLVFTVDTAATSLPADMLLAYEQDNDVTLVEWIVADFVNEEFETPPRNIQDDKSGFEGQDAQINHHQLFIEKCALYMQVEYGQDMMVSFHNTEEVAKHNDEEEQPPSSMRTSRV